MRFVKNFGGTATRMEGNSGQVGEVDMSQIGSLTSPVWWLDQSYAREIKKVSK